MNPRVFCSLALLLLVSSPLMAQLPLVREEVPLASVADGSRTEIAEAAIAAALDKSHLPACMTAGNTLCLNGGRFSIGVGWETADGTVGAGGAVQLTNESGYSYFFSPGNAELVIKVLNGVTYTNPQGRPAPPLRDTNAFPTCP